MPTTHPANQPTSPSLPWRVGSTIVMSMASLLSRSFLYGASKTEIQGLDEFLQILDERKDIDGRERGLLTARPSSLFFYLGQVLPTHRLAHSPHGGLFQPTMTQCIRLLSRSPFSSSYIHPPQDPTTTPSASPSLSSPDITDPFSSSHLTYSTNGHDVFPRPSAYLSRRHSWIHIFPEGRIHQHPAKTVRYFKWGVARLILEAEPLPQIVPIWVEGFDEVMHEARRPPRWLPRPGRTVRVVFGKEVDGEKVFGDLRRRWRMLRRKEGEAGREEQEDVGVLHTDELRYGREAVELRIECTDRMRREVLKLRRDRGWPDEDPNASLAETWKVEVEGGKSREGATEDVVV
ncbi:MAG: hypothetical protein M1816_002737 [Peltula sp. TS41687]|nr:MAG: hypothetical protein M1816_002737 [Peltula sp. TS41687]